MSANGIVVRSGVGQVVDMSPGRSASLKLLNTATKDNVMMFEEVAPAGADTALHLHHDSDEIAYVISGEFTFVIGGETTVGGPGTYAYMPRGIPHAWKNTGSKPGTAIFTYAPGDAGKFFEALAAGRHNMAAMDAAEFAEVVRGYGWEVLGPPPF